MDNRINNKIKHPRQDKKQMTTLQIAFKKAGVKIKKQTKRWPRAKKGTRGQTRAEGGIRNLHFVVGA